MKIFEVTVKLDGLDEKGFIKQLTEKHLAHGFTFTDVEAEVTQALKPYCKGEFEVTAIRKTKALEVFESETDEAFLLTCVSCVFGV